MIRIKIFPSSLLVISQPCGMDHWNGLTQFFIVNISTGSVCNFQHKLMCVHNIYIWSVVSKTSQVLPSLAIVTVLHVPV